MRRLQDGAKAGLCRLLYFDESGFAATPNVQRAWCHPGYPHTTEAVSHQKRVNAIAALDYAAGTLQFDAVEHSVKRPDVATFLDKLAAQGNKAHPTILVLDNAAIHRGFDPEFLHHWLADHHLVLFYLPPYSPELNLIEIVWKQAKYVWRRFSTWRKEQLHQEVSNLLNGYGTRFQISFS